MKFNEEEIKNNLVQPLLQDIGISIHELKFERNFTIQLGRGVYNVAGDPVKTASGRLDILCSRGRTNLFLIELKAENEELTDTDKRQGLSYARLLEPMAPYVLLSNGRETKLYETLSGEVVNKPDASVMLNGFLPNLDSELKLRFEALKQFVGYSYDNLLNFCSIHNQHVLEKFRANPSEEITTQLQKKYLSSVYVSRGRIEDTFKGFISQDIKSVFAIIGESGVGKTNIICRFVEEYATEPVLFYSGSLLSASFLKELSLDFNLDFSPQEAELNILKKISALVRSHNKSFIIFIDAIDEWEAPDKVHQLDQLAKYLNRLDIKLVVSCKTLVWESFLLRNGIPTTFADYLFTDSPKLTDFDASESECAIKKYTGLLGIELLDDTIPTGSTNPFSLRVACEVAYSDNIPLNLSVDSRSTLNKYLLLKLIKSENKDRDIRFLNGLSQYLLETDRVQALEIHVRDALSLSLAEELPPTLFTLNLLYKYIDENSQASLGFYFSTLRDYIISIQVLRLDKLAVSSRIQTIKRLLTSYIGESAVFYYSRTANSSEQITCLEAAIEYDVENQQAILPRMLAWQGQDLSVEVINNLQDRILKHLERVFKDHKSSSVIANQIIDSIEVLKLTSEVETVLVTFFEVLLKHKDDPFKMVSHRLANLLSEMDGPSGTEALTRMVLDQSNDGYIRRYIVESLSTRTVLNRRQIFLALIIDSDPNVTSYVRHWYHDLEDPSLRDLLLEMFEATTDNTKRIALVETLGRSSLPDTGEKLYLIFIEHKSNLKLAPWICRGLAALKYTQAIPDFINLLKSNPSSELSDHIFIALSWMSVTNISTTILELLPECDERLDPWWISGAFISNASEDDYKELEKIVLQSNNEHAVYIAIMIMAQSGDRRYDATIIDFLLHKTPVKKGRTLIFQQWGEKLISLVDLDGLEIPTVDPPDASDDVLSTIYTIFKENTGLSPIALGLLINLEPNPTKLYQEIVNVLPALNYPYTAREISLISYQRMKNLAEVIRPWLNIQLSSSTLSEPFMETCAILAELFGDISTLEVINSNKERLEPILGKGYLEHLENVIRKHKSEVRYSVG